MFSIIKAFLCSMAISFATSMPTAQMQQSVPDSNLTTKSVTAIGYKVGGGSTKVDLKGTELMSVASGEAKVKAKPGATSIELSLIGMIILAHPGLTLAVEGHTDSVGGDEANRKLSEQRADTVRSYLIGQGLSEARISSKGFGKTSPIADNDTATGRQKNRRVEIVVSGEVIGEKIGT